MHIVAVLYYRFVRGENLISAMITGKRPRSHLAPHNEPQFVRHRWALLSLAIAAVLVWWIARSPT